MGGSSSRQKRIRKREYIQETKKEEYTFNPNTYQNLETNAHPGASILSRNHKYRCYPVYYECGSNSRVINTTTDVVKSLDTHNNQRCQPLSGCFENHLEFNDFSNLNDYSMIASAVHQNTANLAKQHYSEDVLVSNCTLRSQPSGIKTSRSEFSIHMHNTVDSNVNDQTNSADDKTQTSVDNIGGLKRNSWEVDEDEGTISGEGLSDEPVETFPRNITKLFDSPVKPTVKRKVPNNDREHVSVPHASYSGTSITQSQYGHSILHISDYANDDDNDMELFSRVETSAKKYEYDLSFDVLDILSFPAEWTSCALDTIGFVDVIPESDEGKAILRLFHKTSVSVSFKLQITSVTRIENPFLHSLYMLKKEEMESRNGHVDELYLYHGTKSENVDQICDNNLNWRLYTERHRFGRGVSFSPSAIYSSHYSGSSNTKVMFLFKVLVSNAEFGSSDMVIPSIQSGVAFDTSIKDDTSVVVKYSDNEFYPLYKIMYTRHANA